MDDLVLQAELRPLQGERFTPAKFPDLGPAEYSLHDGTSNLLVESVQSVANHLENAVWDSLKEDLVEAWRGMPYVGSEIRSWA